MTTDSLQSLMSAKVYAEYDRIRKEDGGANPNIVDSSKGRKELGDLLTNVRQSIKSSKADIVLLKAMIKIYDTCEINTKDKDLKNNDTLKSFMPRIFNEYQNICQGDGGKDSSIVDSAYGYRELQHLLNVAMKEGYPEQDVIMLKALLKASSDYKPTVVNKNNFIKQLTTGYKNKETKEAGSEPIGHKKEKRIPTHKSIKDWMCGGLKKETKTVKQKPVSIKKPSNTISQPTVSNTTNNTGVNNSFNNNSGIIIIK